jgi:hypothetical protein
MSSMIGGTDVIFETARQGFDLRSILDAALEVWPDGFFQNADEEGVRQLTAVLADQGESATHEFFVYKDEASAESWDRDGWTEEHGNDMAHFLVVEDAPRPEMLQLTLVIGSATVETVRLIAAVLEALGRMASGESGQRKRSRRVEWEAELRAVGYTLGREQFYKQVEELSTALFPDWTADELACHPHEAQQFCEVVRGRVAPVPDHLVMKALMNRRRQEKKGTASPELRLSWGA